MACMYLWIIIVISQNNLLYMRVIFEVASWNVWQWWSYNVQLEFIFNAACLLWLLSGYVCH